MSNQGTQTGSRKVPHLPMFQIPLLCFHSSHDPEVQGKAMFRLISVDSGNDRFLMLGSRPCG